LCLGHSIKGNLLGFDSGNKGEVTNPMNFEDPSWSWACLITWICLLQKCDVGSSQVFIARDYFYVYLFFVETWSNVNKVLVYLMVGTQLVGIEF
jgi:hypothetical protein